MAKSGRNRGRNRLVALTAATAIALSLATHGTALRAVEPSPVSPARSESFAITAFHVEGASRLSPDETATLLRTHLGPDRTFADVRAAAKTLETAYAAKGFSVVQVRIPPQEIADGIVTLRVIEAKVGRVVIEGNTHFDDRNVRASLPPLEEGEAPNVEALGRSLRLANENPAKQTTVTLRPTQTEGEVDAAVRIVDRSPHRFGLSLDNTGTPETGDYRIGFGYQHANLFNRDHVLNVQYVTSPSDESDPDRFDLWPNKNVLIVGASYRIPLYGLGDSIDLFGAYSNVNSGVVQNLFNVSGRGTIVAARYNRALPRWADADHKLTLGLDWRAYDSLVFPVGSGLKLVPDIIVHPLSLTWSAVRRWQEGETAVSAGISRNLPGGYDGGQETFDQVRRGAEAGYSTLRFSANHLQTLPADLQARFRLTGQYTRDLLIPGEQFGIGGQDSVRGFLERELIGDRGYSGTFELYSPEAGRAAGLDGFRARALVFYDFGQVRRNEPQVLELGTQAIGSAGVGVRVSYRDRFSLRFDGAIVLDPGGTQERGDTRGHFSVAFAF